MRCQGVCLIGGIVTVDLVEVDHVGIEAVLRHVEHQATGLGCHGSSGIGLDGGQKSLGAAGLHACLDKQAIHMALLLF
ncbi:hypothetical protein D3C79_863880 [compost metagenome]